jgi:uncharacterized protein
MGYSDKGHCPMLIDGECSIYEHRLRTCRDYACRIFAATGIPVDPQTQPEIARRVSEWVFTCEMEESREEHSILQKVAALLRKNRDLFEQRSLPGNPAQLAALAVRITGFSQTRLPCRTPGRPRHHAALRAPSKRAALAENRRSKRHRRKP